MIIFIFYSSLLVFVLSEEQEDALHRLASMGMDVEPILTTVKKLGLLFILVPLSQPSTEPVFADLLRSPGIDSQPCGPVRQPYLSHWPTRLHRLTESIPRNRFLGSKNVYRYGFWLEAHIVMENCSN
jgi:hypothetical protein